MTRGEHRAGAIQQPRSEIKLIGGRQTDSHHVQALVGHPGRESGGQRRRTVPHVVADHHLSRALGTHQSGEGGADIGDQRLVDLFTDQPAHVVSLDDTVDSRGGPRHAEAPDDWISWTLRRQPIGPPVTGPNGARRFAAGLVALVGIGQNAQMSTATSGTMLGGREHTAARRGGMGSGMLQVRGVGRDSRWRSRRVRVAPR